MRSLASRLETLEAEADQRSGADLRGTLEIHFTNAWPHCQGHAGQKYEECTEHPAACAVSIHRTKEPGRVVIVRGPWLGI